MTGHWRQEILTIVLLVGSDCNVTNSNDTRADNRGIIPYGASSYNGSRAVLY